MTKIYEASATVKLEVVPGNGSSPVLTITDEGGHLHGTIDGVLSRDVLYISNNDGENWGGLLDALRDLNVLPADTTIDFSEREGAWASHYSDDWTDGLDGAWVKFTTRQVHELDEDGEIVDVGEVEWTPRTLASDRYFIHLDGHLPSLG